MHLNSKLLFEKYAQPYFKNCENVLEIGPDDYPSSTYKKIINNNKIKWETLDIINNDKLTYKSSDNYHFPIKKNKFDIVLSGQVIEHVPKIWTWIKEVTRVCKIGGYVITIAPVSWTYHEAPVDCWRVYPEGMMALYEEAGLEMKFCKTESLEDTGKRRIIPGVSNSYIDKDSNLKRNLKDIIGWPTTFAFDTIAIGAKLP